MKKLDATTEGIRNAIITLRNDIVKDSDPSHPDEEDEESDNAVIGEKNKPHPLTREMARQKLDAEKRRLAKHHGVGFYENIFQPWIVNDALEKAVTDGLNTIDDWWALSIVKQKKGTI